MAQAEAATVRKQVVVDAPIERAFTVFTERFGDFKPAAAVDRQAVDLRWKARVEQTAVEKLPLAAVR
jgi:hypothetical protein